MSRVLGAVRRALAATLLRSGIFAAIIGAAVVVASHAAAARGSEFARSAGLELWSYARALHIDAPRTLRVNGLTLHVASGVAAEPISELLDFYGERCRMTGSDFAALLARDARTAALERRARAAGGVLDPVFRHEDERSGYLGCFDFGASALAPEDIVKRARAFAERADLAAWGDLRFVWAMRDGGQTAYVVVASEGPLPLAQAFPAQGDAPGVDAPELPRPPHARRLLSAYQEHEAPLLVSYRAELGAEQAAARYRGRLIDGGFVVREAPVAPGASTGARALLLRRRDRETAVVIEPLGGGASAITVLPLD